jgi:hypothetical protein
MIARKANKRDNIYPSTNEKFRTIPMCTSKRGNSQEEWRMGEKATFFLGRLKGCC